MEPVAIALAVVVVIGAVQLAFMPWKFCCICEKCNERRYFADMGMETDVRSTDVRHG